MNGTNAVLEAKLDALVVSLDMLYASALAIWIFFMTAGFTFLEAGSAASKNVQNIIMKNVLDASFALVVYYIFGYALAFGTAAPSNSFVGLEHFFAIDASPKEFLLQFMFSINTVTIFGGSVQGRTRFLAYIIVSVFVSGVIYPLAAHWVWSPAGWLAKLGPNGLIDVSGSGVVHLVGGCVGLAGAVILGPRQNRFPPDGQPGTPYHPHSMPLCALGAMFLWTGWFAFNAAGTHVIPGSSPVAVLRAITNTLASGCAAGVGTFFFNRFFYDRYDLMMVLNTILSGLVAITAGCAVVRFWAALIIGFLAPVIFLSSNRLLHRLRIDDPLSAVPVHAFSGAWGLFSTGLLADKHFIAETYGSRIDTVTSYGLLLGGGWAQLGTQLLGILVLALWSSAVSFAVFFCLNRFGSLRIDTDTEMAGMDALKHGTTAYSGFNMAKC